jgi:hypothetical protein
MSCATPRYPCSRSVSYCHPELFILSQTCIQNAESALLLHEHQDVSIKIYCSVQVSIQKAIRTNQTLSGQERNKTTPSCQYTDTITMPLSEDKSTCLSQVPTEPDTDIGIRPDLELRSNVPCAENAQEAYDSQQPVDREQLGNFPISNFGMLVLGVKA